MSVKDTYHKGLRAESQARKQWEDYCWITDKARCSRGAWDFEVRTAGAGAACVPYGIFFGVAPRAYVQVKCNTMGDSKAKFRKALKDGRLPPTACCIVQIRHDGSRWNPPTWEYILLDNAKLLAETPHSKAKAKGEKPK